MTQQAIPEVVGVKQNVDYCSSCSICSTLCPYEALKKDEEGKITLDITKCQVCGLCYANCPAGAIDTIYYDVDSLLKYLERAKQQYASDTLVIMCRGSAPDLAGVEELFGITKFIPLLVPCVGRLPEEIYLKSILMGIEKIYLLACDENYCRYERGSPVTGRKILAFNAVLDQLGYGREVLTLKRHSLKVKVDKELCIHCGNCVFYCPYDAAKLEGSEAATFDLDLCRGCGLCMAMCPAFALDLDNWEKERISALIADLSTEMKSPKILVLRCQWAVFPPLNGEMLTNTRFIDLPCASRVDMFHILEAFRKGVDGVLVAACFEEDCKQERASGKTQHSIEKLIERLNQIGLGERLHFCTTSPRYPEEFNDELEQFAGKIAALGSKEGGG